MQYPQLDTISTFLLGLLLLAGCAGRPPSDADAPAGTTAPKRPSGRLGIEMAAFMEAARTGNFPAVLERLNPPLRIKERPVENRHVPGQIDMLRTYIYDGLRFTVYDITGSSKTLLQDFAITSTTYTTPRGVRVGMERQEVRATLGAPDEKQDGAWVYRFDPEPVPFSTLHVRFNNDTVRTLDWSFYIG